MRAAPQSETTSDRHEAATDGTARALREALTLVTRQTCPHCLPRAATEARAVVRDALERGAFEFHVQRIVTLDDDATETDYELLLRLRRDNGELVSPATFLPGAERAGLATIVDRYVIEVLLAWLETLPPGIVAFDSLAVNLSAQSVGDDAFRRYVLSRLDSAPFDCQRLRFEITETACMANLHEARRFIDALGDRGVGVSLDDFGAGFTSLAYLKHLPCDRLKIDQEFVRDIASSEFDRAVVGCATELAGITGMAVVAEGVESAAAHHALRALGVRFGQGYFFHRPAPMATLLADAGPQPAIVTPVRAQRARGRTS